MCTACILAHVRVHCGRCVDTRALAVGLRTPRKEATDGAAAWPLRKPGRKGPGNQPARPRLALGLLDPKGPWPHPPVSLGVWGRHGPTRTAPGRPGPLCHPPGTSLRPGPLWPHSLALRRPPGHPLVPGVRCGWPWPGRAPLGTFSAAGGLSRTQGGFRSGVGRVQHAVAASHRAWSSVAAWPHGGSLCGQQVTRRLQARSVPWGPVNYLPLAPGCQRFPDGTQGEALGPRGAPTRWAGLGGWAGTSSSAASVAPGPGLPGWGLRVPVVGGSWGSGLRGMWREGSRSLGLRNRAQEWRPEAGNVGERWGCASLYHTMGF